ncbi:hypothetical protein [Ferrovibrio sp.]|uniref:hypothetical protein n=1 Tax=Ferrovibrio sp. TaxID=1917215 RepID=UPI0035B2AE0A
MADAADLCCDDACGLASCPSCLEAWRKPFLKQLRALLATKLVVTYATVIMTDPKVRQKKLARVIESAVMQRFRMLLRRHGLSHLVIVGILEADWSERTRCWEPHFHIFILGSRPDFTSLAKALHKKDRFKGQRGLQVFRPVDSAELFDAIDVVNTTGYSAKFRMMRKWPYYLSNGNIKNIKSNLRGKQAKAAHKWLGKPPRDFVFLQNVRLDANGFRLIAKPTVELPLSGETSKTRKKASKRVKGGAAD